MYKYDKIDQQIIDERVAQYRDQTERFLAGEIPDDEFQQLRLRNGLYVQRLAPMLRIAIPYGMLSSAQLRKLAHLSRHYDKGYGHFTTRQNLQLNWPLLSEVPDILEELASVEMHAIQTSGSCIRNITTDQYAGAAADELEDPRPWAEIIRQWSTMHPEFNWLPRKFKIAVSGATGDRAAIEVHDIGIRIIEKDGVRGFEVLAGGGLGRTPVVGKVINPFLPREHLLTYLEAALRVYNRHGRRDNKYKARIKILVRAMTAEVFSKRVDEEWQTIINGPGTLTEAEIERSGRFFTRLAYKQLENEDPAAKMIAGDAGFKTWLRNNVKEHQVPGYAICNISLKATAIAPGDATDEQMDFIADLADRYSFGELRVTHEQNLTLADVAQSDVYALWQELVEMDLAAPNLGLLTDMICCPGGDFCSLANAKSIPVAESIQRRFDDLDYLHDLGNIDLNISGCMNACGHHHVGNIGILGVDKKGAEFYQVSIGGSALNDSSIGQILGPSFAQREVPDVVEKLVDLYVDKRADGESFLDTFNRLGVQIYKDAVYS
jgi:sulfite reductase (NADPH) hemoprotein beta-component